MGPDRSNYEIWFIDLLDGKLTEGQVEELKVFLRQNPDLQEELDGLSSVSLKASDIKLDIKKQLIKSPENLSDSQFDHLCIANLENDLSPDQKDELNDMLDQDESRKKRFELIQKLKLNPPDYVFEKKSILKKLTAGQKLLRLSVIVTSTAAVVALVVTAYLSFIREPGRQDLLSLQEAIAGDTIYIESVLPVKADHIAFPSEINNINLNTDPNTQLTSASTIKPEFVEPTVFTRLIKSDTAPEIVRKEALTVLNVSVPENLFNPFKNQINALIPYEPAYITPLFGDNRSNVDRFLARLFREKIMNDTISGSRPVQSFDIALAGVNGINKLLGWEMALHKNTDENGEIRSYYFSSKLIRFNAPVKKTDNAL